MNATLTLRLRDEQWRQLRELASKLGTSDSELVRDMIQRSLAEVPLRRRIAHLKGGLAERPSRTDSLSRDPPTELAIVTHEALAARHRAHRSRFRD